MNAERKQKVSQVKEISEKLASSKALVIAEYAGLTVQELQTLKKELKEKGVEAKVYKNRLFKIAAKEAKIDLEESLVGPNIYAFGMEDDISPAKVLANFAKKHAALKLKAGTYEGKVIDADELAIISTLPSFDEALTILAMSMMSPLKNISVGLNMLVQEGKLESSPAEESKIEEKEAPIQVETKVIDSAEVEKSEEKQTGTEVKEDVQETPTPEETKEDN